MNLSLALGPSTPFVLIALLAFVFFFFAAWLPIERGRRPNLRILRPLGQLRRLIAQNAENGQRVHYSPGTGGLDGQTGSAEALSGLTSLSSAARLAARSKAHLTVTTDDTLAYLLADDVVQAEYVAAGRREDYRPTDVRFVTQQDRLAYIAGTSAVLADAETGGNIMLGRFDAEYLLAGDQANRRDLPQVVGSSRVEALPLMIASAGPENTLIGEEVFAAPAYLDRQPAHFASLVAQDRARLVILVIIVLGVLATTVSSDIAANIGNFFLR